MAICSVSSVIAVADSKYIRMNCSMMWRFCAILRRDTTRRLQMMIYGICSIQNGMIGSGLL